MTKSLVIQCDNWIEQLYDKQIFNPNANTWKWILTAKNWIVPVHNILLTSNLNDICATNENYDEKIKPVIGPADYDSNIISLKQIILHLLNIIYF